MMTLLDVYIQEVTKRLPAKMRADIGLELRSTIEDMLPEDYTEEELLAVLAKLGDPMKLANEYHEGPSSLIGPIYYELYLSTIRMIMPIVLAVILLTFVATSFLRYNGTDLFSFMVGLLGEGIWMALGTGIHVLFWVTLVFVIVERAGVSPHLMRSNAKEWSPEELKEIEPIPKKKAISKAEVFATLVWTAIWGALYFSAIDLIGIYTPREGGGLELVTSIFSKEVLLTFWPVIMLIIAAEIALSIIKWVSGQWTMQLALFNSFYNVLYTVLFIIILTTPTLFEPTFVSYMTNVFADSTSTTVDQFFTWILASAIITLLVVAIISTLDGFRKARL
ncbi:hypothetical protein AB3N04_06685 [Alkalihalophilus sp. As8PL]|uniref:Uncharacterized protein n=1 Tax=Alkalihalophilus sp. As8PL TaxID=3237103 RepID=A0AB39BW09_9BACI